MKTKVKKWLVKHGNVICAVAVSLASLSSLCCRGTWYQPEGTGRGEGVCKKSCEVEMGGRSL